MSKHIHIHLRGAARIVGGKTGDAGWDESKHKRDDSGKFGSGGGGGKKPDPKSTPAAGGKPKGGQPVEPNLPGPRSQKAIQAIKAAAAKGDWRAVANVPVIGTHPQVHAYREAMAEHLQAGAKASREATHGTPPPTSLSHGGQKYTSTGKQGKGPDGVQHEYEAVDKEGRRTGARVWRTASGKVIPD